LFCTFSRKNGLAIVVTSLPDLVVLKKQLEVLLPQVGVAITIDNRYVSIDYLVSSGGLILMHVFSDVGLVREGLFVDYVDAEWG